MENQDKVRKYEAPKVMPLGGLARGAGQEPYCGVGSSAHEVCNHGAAASGHCFDGGTAAYYCRQGSGGSAP